MVECKKCRMKIDCDCMECHYCNPEAKCSECGFCHSDGWEAGACWSFHNNPDYDPFDI